VRLRRTLLRLSLPILLVLYTGTTFASCVPETLARTINRSYESWRIVELDSLSPEQRLKWRKKQTTACPGVVLGRFKPGYGQIYAVLLWKRSDNVILNTLVLIDKRGKIVSVLEKSVEADALAVLRRVPPGIYKDAEQISKVRTPMDSVSYEVPGAGAILYYWKGGKFNSIVTSE
jgi:hypothetical protein